MSIRVYSEINLHITWNTKDSQRLITPEMQPDLYAFLKNKIVQVSEPRTSAGFSTTHNQREHPSAGTIHDRLERTEDESP